ncbi:MAG: hypothetical protein IIB19_03040, partial [Chloroflexi bacterium]|nr:hypothetical protein [Chloroflexota bacterium]
MSATLAMRGPAADFFMAAAPERRLDYTTSALPHTLICYRTGAMTEAISDTKAAQTGARKAGAAAGATEETVVVVRLGEITLKKRNRPLFVRQLGRNIRHAVRGLGVRDVEWGPNRILIKAGPSLDWPELRDRLRRVFGLQNFSLCQRLPWDVDAIREGVLQQAAERSFESFRITVQRSDKRFPGTSQELERMLGALVKEASGARVDLSHPEETFQVEIMPGGAYLHTERIDGAAGLPVGVSGRVVALLSGGI